MRPGPIPIEDLYIDEDGYISSKTLDAAHEQYDYRRFGARYGKLEDEFYTWTDNCCEHGDGDHCCEWVANWAGVAQFNSLVEEAGGEVEFPLLSTMLPSANGGLYPAEKAEKTLEELDRFLSKISGVKCWTLCTSETNETIWTSTRHSEFTRMLGPYDRVSMAGDKVLFHHAGRAPVATSHFKQVPIGSPDSNGFQRMMIVCLDSNERTVTFGSIGPTESPPTEREFIVIPQYAPFLHHGKYWTAERIRNLLVASIETSNPIRWC